MAKDTLIKHEDRFDFLPEMVGRSFNLFESNLYQMAEKKIQNYNGGYWEFCKSEVEDEDDTITVYWLYPKIGDCVLFQADNWFEEQVSEQTAGLALTLYMLNMFIHYWHDKGESELQSVYTKRYYDLREYSLSRTDSNLVWRFLD